MDTDDSNNMSSVALNQTTAASPLLEIDWGSIDMGYTVKDLALPWEAQLGLILLYSVTIILSVMGNLLVIIVLISAKRSRMDINIFLVNLAAADLCMACFCIPFTFTQTMLGRWIFGRVMCPLALFMQVFSVGVSIFTNMAIGIERFWGIVLTMKPRLSRSKIRLITGAIWLVAGALASPQLFVSRADEKLYMGIRYFDCNERWSSQTARHVYTLLIACVTYILPLAILAAVYFKIGSILWTRKLPGNADNARDKLVLRSTKKVIKMVFTLVVVFSICWLPLHTFNLVLDFAPYLLDYIETRHEHYIFLGVYYACHWLAMANSFTNPLIFCFLNTHFRVDMRSVLLCERTSRRSSSKTRRMRMTEWLFQRHGSFYSCSGTPPNQPRTKHYTQSDDSMTLNNGADPDHHIVCTNC